MPEQLVPEHAKIVLPPHGFVDLQATCASDLDVVNAARVSVGQMSKWKWETPDGEVFEAGDELDHWLQKNGWTYTEAKRVLPIGDVKLIHVMMKGKHGSPFEHNFMKWHIRAPIFVFREWHRHRIGVSINEESARYTQLSGDFYVPASEDIRGQVGKAMNYTYETVDGQIANEVQDQLQSHYSIAYSEYEHLLSIGIAREVARLVLPVGIHSQMIWSCNARSLMNFLSLRNAPTAQREIRMYAEAMENLFSHLMPVTHAAFVENDRVAP